jgi:hypothetical protein
LTLWTKDGTTLADDTGRLIEAGSYDAIALEAVEGAQTFLPGATVPNYTLMAPTRLNILKNSLTVEDATFLSELLQPNMGHMDWAACLRYRGRWFMRYDDLTPYQYCLSAPVDTMIHVGWIDERSAVGTSGRFDHRVPRLLERYYEDLVAHQTRGYHDCPFCPLGSAPAIAGGRIELWVPRGNDAVYASPDLIIHYIDSHGYCPPTEYQAAVLSLPDVLTGWDKRKWEKDVRGHRGLVG